jgi:hypothetical protein
LPRDRATARDVAEPIVIRSPASIVSTELGTSGSAASSTARQNRRARKAAVGIERLQPRHHVVTRFADGNCAEAIVELRANARMPAGSALPVTHLS